MTGEQVEPDLLGRLAVFARLLRDAGLTTGPGRLADAARALAVIDVRSREDVRHCLRAVYVSRREDIDLFEAAFDVFWTRPARTRSSGAVPGHSRSLPLDPERARAWREALALPGAERGLPQEGEPAASSGYSAVEMLRRRDFADLTWEEAQQVRRLLDQSPWRLAERRTRRRRPTPGGPLDVRATVRRSVRASGDVLPLRHARPRLRRRSLVLLCDVSGSMERYSRQLLLFAHAISRRERVETFVFSTRLTRITPLLRRRDVDGALDEVSGRVHDIGGGTRIGEALHEFNRSWARRVLGHGAVVLLISDGWDRGDPDRLAAEMARLRRSCHRLVWLNPLLGSPDYRPETRGMAAALPHCDDFLAAHSVAALDELGQLLAGLPRRRPERGRPPR